MKKIIIFLLLSVNILFAQHVFSQEYYLPLNREYNLRYEPYLYSTQSQVHTSVRPFISSEAAVAAPLDSLNTNYLNDSKFNNSWIGRKLRREHLLEVMHEDYNIFFDPVFEFSGTADDDDNFYFTGTKGARIAGTIGERFSFASDFYETQARFPQYVDSMIRATNVVPGGARVKQLYGNFDYAIASGSVSYSLKKYFNFQLGHDKVFIGDGYRSLLLSDNAFNFPFLKITATIWKIKYMNLFTAFQDLNIRSSPNDGIFTKKYGSFHYLDINIGNKASFGILEAIIWKSDSATGRGFDLNYVNPFIFFRPVEFSLGSPDNALIGFNLKYKINSSNVVYGQFLLDEFKLSDVRSGRGWWANKQAAQIGFKTFNILAVQHLHFNTEFNFVRPYTYQHVSSLTAYGHYNQPIAHPLGANFYETVSIINYSYKNYFLRAQAMYALIGYDLNLLNYGQNVFKSYLTHPSDYGNETGQGLRTKQWFGDLRLGYLVNPKTNFIAEAGITARRQQNIHGTTNSIYIYGGIRTALTNRYYDF